MSHEGTTVLETNYQVEASDDFQSAPKLEHSETEDARWAELTDFVRANAYKLVECPWQPGVEMTLSAISNEWQYHVALITLENVDSVLAELKQLLANKIQKTEDELNATLDDDELEILDSEQPEDIPKPVTGIVKKSKDEAIKTKISSKIIVNQVATSKAPSLSAVQPVVTNTISAPYSSLSTENIAGSLKDNYSGVVEPKINSQPHPETQLPTVEVTNFKHEIDTPQKSEEAPLAPMVQKVNHLILKQPATFVIDEPMVTLVQEATLGIPSKSFSNKAEHIETITVIEQISAALPIENIETIQVSLNESAEQDDLTHAEDILAEIAEAVEQSEPETAQKVYEFMSKIVDVSSVIDHEDDTSKEEVTILFTELLDTLGMDYTPELLESLLQLVTDPHSAQTVKNKGLEEIDTTDESLQSSTATKIVQQLTATLAHIKAVVDQTCSAIGKSALHHYGLHLGYAE